MKIKVDKKVKPQDTKLHQVKKSKNDIVKPKEKKTGGPAGAAPHTFAEKKVLAVKQKNKKDKLVETVKAAKVQTPAVQKISKQEKVQKKKSVKGVEVKKVAGVVQQKDASEKSKRKRKWKKVKKQKNQDDKDPSENADQLGLPKVLVSQKTIKAALKACKKALDGGFEQKKNLFGEDLKYGLQIAAVKIPDAPSRNCRVQLPNPIYQKGDDICLIVKDMTRGSKQDHEETLNFWTDKLRELGIDYITQVIPFHQLKQDYKEYEMKLKLANRFDRFLVDARINGHVYNFLGTGFIRRCKNPTPVILEKDEKIVKSLTKALGRFTYKQTNTGRITEIQFATHKMPLEKAVENAESLVESLKTQFPGGWLNIRTIYLKPMTDIQLTFPLYVSKIDPNLVPVPNITGPRERFEKSMNEQMLEATRNKYKFQGGDLVRVAFEERKPKRQKRQEVEEGEAEEEKEAAEGEQNSDNEEEMQELGPASDTEGSDADDDEE